MIPFVPIFRWKGTDSSSFIHCNDLTQKDDPNIHSKGIKDTNSFFLILLFSRSVISNSLWPHELQHAWLPCPSPSPGTCSNSWPLSPWCHPTISSSVIPFSCPQSLPASGSFPMSQFFPSGGQSIGVSAFAWILPVNIQDWFPLGWTGWISSQSKGLSRVFCNTTVQKHQFFGAQLSLWSNSHIHTRLLEQPAISDGCNISCWLKWAYGNMRTFTSP